MSIKALLLSFFICQLCNTSLGQGTPLEMVNKFFDIYKSQGSDKALDYLTGTNKNSGRFKEQINNLKDKLSKAHDQIGPFYGFDPVVTKSAGPNYTMLTFLVRHERAPLTFRFTFYRPKDSWMWIDFKYNDSMDEELDAASKNH